MTKVEKCIVATIAFIIMAVFYPFFREELQYNESVESKVPRDSSNTVNAALKLLRKFDDSALNYDGIYEVDVNDGPRCIIAKTSLRIALSCNWDEAFPNHDKETVEESS